MKEIKLPSYISFETKYSRMDQAKLSISRACCFKFSKDCLSQILLGPFLNTLSDLQLPLSHQV